MLLVTEDISSVHLTIQFDSHCGFTYNAFSPVTGWVLTIGCSLMTGSLRTAPFFPFEA
jgi:hypothetical protein